MSSPVIVGLLGLCAVALLITGQVVGQLALGPMGGLVGLVMGFLLSGWMLRTYFAHRHGAAHRR